MLMGRRVYTGGTFDLFHAGHVNFLRQCKQIAQDDEVIVGLNTDEFILEYKKKTPIYSYEDRKAILLSNKYVDSVVPNLRGWDSSFTIGLVRPSFVVIGTDWAKKDYYTQMGFTQEWLDNMGIVLMYVPYTEGISTTALKEKILAR